MGWWEAVAAWWDRLLVGLGLRRPRLAADARLDLATARAGVAHVEAVAAVRANQPPLIRAPMRALVQELGERAVRLGELAGEPSEGLRADGLELAELATRAAAAVGARGLKHERERALGLAANAVLAVASTEHDRVGPAMIAWAEATAAIGNAEQARSCYRAVVSDFAVLVDRAGDEDAALACLQTALERLDSVGEGQPDLLARVVARRGG